MNYFLFRLGFKSPVHFGPSDSALSAYTSEDHFRGDTLFSALCHTALELQGPEGVDKLIAQVKNGDLLLSDSMPWADDILYIPKPCFHSEKRQEISSIQRKAMKKLSWIPIPSFASFADSLRGGAPYDALDAKTSFGTDFERTQAKVTDGKDTEPYQVGGYHFRENCGLWFLAACSTDAQAQQLCKLVTCLGLSGIGGKTSSGYGRFEVLEFGALSDIQEPQRRWLHQSLSQEQAEHYLLLTSSLPTQEELEEVVENAYFQVVRRGGFVQSEAYNSKKQTQYFLAAGAVTQQRFHGALYSVGGEGSHPVYRYSLPIMMGVSL